MRECFLSRPNWLKMLKKSLPIVNALGLHARAAAQLVRLAATFRCRITLVREDTGLTANAKSILSVLHLAASFGSRMHVTADGDDETEAVEAIAKLFQDGFGEI